MKVKTITLKIECGNDAFQGEGGAAELQQIFRETLPWAAYELHTESRQRTVELKLRDSNGNYCAVLTVEREDE
jgi:hypothetical protein